MTGVGTPAARSSGHDERRERDIAGVAAVDRGLGLPRRRKRHPAVPRPQERRRRCGRRPSAGGAERRVSAVVPLDRRAETVDDVLPGDRLLQAHRLPAPQPPPPPTTTTTTAETERRRRRELGDGHGRQADVHRLQRQRLLPKDMLLSQKTMLVSPNSSLTITLTTPQ